MGRGVLCPRVRDFFSPEMRILIAGTWEIWKIPYFSWQFQMLFMNCMWNFLKISAYWENFLKISASATRLLTPIQTHKITPEFKLVCIHPGLPYISFFRHFREPDHQMYIHDVGHTFLY